jgi:hypothetical protein
MADTLSPTMTLRDFENGYWYLEQLKNFAGRIGIPAAKKTKDFIVEQAHLMTPEVREKSGVWYRLNRWREEQITSNKHPTRAKRRTLAKCKLLTPRANRPKR